MTRELAKYELGLLYGLKTALHQVGRDFHRDDENRMSYLQEFLDNQEDSQPPKPPQDTKLNYTDEIPF